MSCGKCSDRSTCSFWFSKAWHSFRMRGLDPLMRYTPCDGESGGGRGGKGGGGHNSSTLPARPDVWASSWREWRLVLPPPRGRGARSQLCSRSPQRARRAAGSGAAPRGPRQTPSPFCGRTPAGTPPCTSCAKPGRTEGRTAETLLATLATLATS